MRRPALIASALLVLILTTITPILLSFRTESLGTNIRILALDQSGSHVLITNVGTRTVQVTVGHQTFSNGKWDPPKEELFSYPSEVLRPEERFTMVFTNVVASNVSWRAGRFRGRRR